MTTLNLRFDKMKNYKVNWMTITSLCLMKNRLKLYGRFIYFSEISRELKTLDFIKSHTKIRGQWRYLDYQVPLKADHISFVLGQM